MSAGASTSDSTPPSDSASAEETGRGDHAARGFESAGQLEAHHAAEPAHLTRRDTVLGMAGPAGIVHTRHRRVKREKFCDQGCIPAVPLHSYIQGLDPAQNQPGIIRPRDRADRILKIRQPRVQLRIVHHDGAADYVGMSIQVLGGGMHDGRSSQLQRALQVQG